jgi:D-alanyl-lipoteichoic acid acyltransferase DltB (MBOAT superfamily)
MKAFVALSFVLNLSILFFFKYFNFTVDTINHVLSMLHMNSVNAGFDIILPVGISFYTFQALSYTMDVYRGDIYCERNFLKYALFVSFFPQLVAGPIERSRNLLKQISVKHEFRWDKVREGLTQMLFGYFQKVVISDNISVLVDQVYNNYPNYGAVELILATIFFAFQIYCDFGGYSNIAIGAAKVMGFDLMENFNTPYMSLSVAEFWRRWHISLSTWFRDYLYIPLGGNRKGRLRKYVNIMVVFLASGLWHGASWHYVAWGAQRNLPGNWRSDETCKRQILQCLSGRAKIFQP